MTNIREYINTVEAELTEAFAPYRVQQRPFGRAGMEPYTAS
jgi:hypothetical protein